MSASVKLSAYNRGRVLIIEAIKVEKKKIRLKTMQVSNRLKSQCLHLIPEPELSLTEVSCFV